MAPLQMSLCGTSVFRTAAHTTLPTSHYSSCHMWCTSLKSNFTFCSSVNSKELLLWLDLWWLLFTESPWSCCHWRPPISLHIKYKKNKLHWQLWLPWPQYPAGQSWVPAGTQSAPAGNWSPLRPAAKACFFFPRKWCSTLSLWSVGHCTHTSLHQSLLGSD